MYTPYLLLTRPAYRVILLFLGISLLAGCGQSHQLGMEDNPQEILEMKLNNRDAVLTSAQSVSLLGHCVELGRQNAAAAAERNAIAIVGTTGAGKSTTANYWMGCKMHAEIIDELPCHSSTGSVYVSIRSIGARRISVLVQRPIPCRDRADAGYSTRGRQDHVSDSIDQR